MATITITINTESDSDLKDSLSLILGLIEGKKLGEKKTAADLIEPSPDTTPLPPSSPVKENQIELPGYAVCNTCHVYKKIVAKGKCGYCYQKERAFLKEEERKKKPVTSGKPDGEEKPKIRTGSRKIHITGSSGKYNTV